MALEVKDYYELLGISRTANGDEMHKAFRRLARQYHPDLVPDKAVAEEKFKEINEAYEVLSDPVTRSQYDRGELRRHNRREKWRCPTANGRNNFRPCAEKPEFQSFDDRVFHGPREKTNGFATGNGNRSSNAGNGPRCQNQSAQRGNDIQMDVWISLEEVLRGSIQSVSVLRHHPLTGCTERHALPVRIPPGVRQGQSFRLPGKGDYGLANGEAGDLFLRVHLAVHPRFRVNGSDLFCDLHLTPWEAFFGAKKTIPTMEGPVSMNVPPGTKNQHRLRLRGKGLPAGHGSRGDLYALVSVSLSFTDMVGEILHRD